MIPDIDQNTLGSLPFSDMIRYLQGGVVVDTLPFSKGLRGHQPVPSGVLPGASSVKCCSWG